MIKNAKAWAQARGLCEVNEVHGKEEFRIPTERMFEHTRSSGTLTSQKLNFTAEDTFFATRTYFVNRIRKVTAENVSSILTGTLFLLGFNWVHAGKRTRTSGNHVPWIWGNFEMHIST